MSTYIQFFLGTSEGLKVELFNYSRSSFVYNKFSARAPYGKAEMLTKKIVESFARDCFDSRVYYENRLSALDKEIAKISGFCNSVEDKLEAISYLEDGEKRN